MQQNGRDCGPSLWRHFRVINYTRKTREKRVESFRYSWQNLLNRRNV